MAEKKGQTIVIKKIYVTAGGHGGAWKVALADFMTALMAFFLVLWLLGQSEETKKAVSDHFSTPSVLEYEFQNFGAEVTLEKLFLDLINEPMKAFQSFMEPIDKTPNFLDMGSQKIVMAAMAEQLGDVAKNAVVTSDTIEFDIMDYTLFIPGTATPNDSFVKVMEKVKTMTTGLKDANVTLRSLIFHQTVFDSTAATADRIASERLDLISRKIQASFEHSTVDLKGSIQSQAGKNIPEGVRPPGMIRIKIQQKEFKSTGQRARKMESLFGAEKDMGSYNKMVQELTEQKKKDQKIGLEESIAPAIDTGLPSFDETKTE